MAGIETKKNVPLQSTSQDSRHTVILTKVQTQKALMFHFLWPAMTHSVFKNNDNNKIRNKLT